MQKLYDVVIIGSGPAGLAAGLYAARAKMETLILEKNKAGGQIVTTNEVANYPGSIEHATGPSLIARMVEQAEVFGAERKKDNVIGVDFTGKVKIVKGEEGEYHAKSVIIASGATPRLIGCPGEKELTGKGVSYCATCDADFFTDLEVFVIGGGDSAVEEALYLTKFAKKVTIVHRRDKLRAAKSIQEKAFNHEKIHFMWDTTVEEIKGDGVVESVVFKNVKTEEIIEYHANEEDGTFGIFPFVGYYPLSHIYKGKIQLDEAGYIPTDDTMRTNVPGVFAAGDIRVKNLRQVVTAVADGAIAAVQAEKYIEHDFENEKMVQGGKTLVAIDKDTFQTEVLEAEGYVLVDFWSDGCEPCKALMPDMEELAKKYASKMKFTKLNTSKARRLAIGQKVLGLPTIAIYKDGEKIDEATKDEATKANIEAMIQKHIE